MRSKYFIVILLLLGTIFAKSPEQKQGFSKNAVKIVPGKFVVKFKANSFGKINQSGLSYLLSNYQIKSYEEVFKKAKNKFLKTSLNLQNVFEFYVDESTDIWAICEELNKRPDVEYAEPVYLAKVDEVTPNDPLYSQQPFLSQVSAPLAWDIQKGDTTVIIGIIDTGVDTDHEDLADVIWTNPGEIPGDGIDNDNNGYVDDVHGWDFVTNISDADGGEDGDVEDNDPMDFDGHGTHVAGLAAGNTNNGVGIASVSWGARIMPLRCGYHSSDGNGYVPSDFAAKAYQYAADNGAHITNQSSGSGGQLIVDAAYYAFQNGVLICESAGNSNAPTPSALGLQPFVMTVAALNSDDIKASYSSFGEYVDIAAPGGDFSSGNKHGLLSTIVYPSTFFGGNKYIEFQGTSMASPVVASVAALIKQAEPNLSVLDLYTRLQATADNLDALNPLYAGKLGAGRVNAYRALTEKVYAAPKIDVVHYIIDDSQGNNNHRIDDGENFTLKLIIKNSWKNATNINATLLTENNGLLSITNGTDNLAYLGGILDLANSVDTLKFQIAAANSLYPAKQNFTLQITDNNGYQQNINIPISIMPKILLVGDYTDLDVSNYYKNVLDSLHIVYDYYERSKGSISSDVLKQYPVVIWSCEWAFPSLDESDRTAIQDYLNSGGYLFISGQDIGWDLADPNSGNSNEYGKSLGSSKTFYNNYLKANYISDNANQSSLSGIQGDPITNGLSITINQPGRSANNQYPDVISPLGTATSIFNYPDGTSGALRYEGNYKLVYFAFGGFEAIIDEATRFKVMENILQYFTDLKLYHTPVSDREDTTSSIQVNVALSTTVNNVFLYYKKSGDNYYQKIQFTNNGDTTYTAIIPAPNEKTEISYFILAQRNNGIYIISDIYSFTVGVDLIPPTITLLNKPLVGNTINWFGLAPYKIQIHAEDNNGIDEQSAKIHVTVNNGNELLFPMTSLGNGDFEGTFSFDPALRKNDMVQYYLTVEDISSSRNLASTDTFTLTMDTTMVLDNFENGLDFWSLQGDWAATTLVKYEGNSALDDNPYLFYGNNIDYSAEYKIPLNLLNYDQAQITFWTQYDLEQNADFVYFEVSKDGGNSWASLLSLTGTQKPDFVQKTVDLIDYVGEPDVRFRFRIVTNGSVNKTGITIDDIRISVKRNPLAIEEQPTLIPTSLVLQQNYPNPFNPITFISFGLPSTMHVELNIYNIMGQKVKTLINQIMSAGTYKASWDGKNDLGEVAPSGIYIYELRTNTSIIRKKMLFLK